MRVITTIMLLLQVFRSYGQPDTIVVNSEEHAVSIALLQNPSVQSAADQGNLSRDVKSTWFHWIFRINEWLCMQEHLQLLHDLGRVADLRYAEGDIDLLEQSSFRDLLADIQSRTVILSHEIDIAGNVLRQYFHTADFVIPADTMLSMYQIHKTENPNAALQTIDSALKMENLQLQLENLFIRIQYFQNAGLEHARLVLLINQAKLNAEEIDYLEYAKALDESFRIKQEYLKTIHDYNQTAIELEHYAY